MRNRSARGWPYVVTGVLFAGICAWISYNDGLFVARLAGNGGGIVFFYPLVPDVMITLSLLALVEAARADAERPKWAVAGLVLGAGATLAMNTYAGVEHSALDAVIDGLIPVFFFIAVEVVLWHVRHVGGDLANGATNDLPGAVPSDVLSAARASMAATVAAGNPLSQNQLQQRWPVSRAQAREIWREFTPDPPAGEPPRAAPAPAGAHLNGNGAHG